MHEHAYVPAHVHDDTLVKVLRIYTVFSTCQVAWTKETVQLSTFPFCVCMCMYGV